MRSAPNYKQGHAVDGKWKQELLIYLGYHFILKTFIETGTCDGGTLEAVYNRFRNSYSIELSDYYYKISSEKFKDVDKVKLFHGNSATLLREVINDYVWDNSCLFWLDAHSSGGKTANEGDPLPEEIRAIVELSPDSLVVIDDHNSADEVFNKCKENGIDLTGWTLEFRTGIVFLHKGQYKIPEFE